MTNLKNITQKMTKTIIGIVTLMVLFNTSVLANNTNLADGHTKSFEAQIVLEQVENKFEISFKNAEAPVQITMIELEDGIVYSTTTSLELFSKYFSPDSLPVGEYTVLVEYKGEVVESKMFNIEENIQVTLLDEEEGIVFSQRGTMSNLNQQIKAQNLPEGEYTILIEREGNVETKAFEAKK